MTIWQLQKGAAGIALAVVAIALAGTAAARDMRTERVSFAAGARSAVVEGTVTGYDVVDYLLRARAGQSMNVSMATNHLSNHFNILEPGETDIAIFNSSMASGGNQFEGTLSKSGDYRVRVYLMRSAARRNESAAYRLEMIVAGAPDAAGRAHGWEVPPSPSEGGPRRWQVTGVTSALNLRKRPSTAGPVVARLDPGAVLSNLGCESAGRRVWCRVQPFRGGPVGYAAAEYLSPAVAPHGAALHGEDDSALRAGRGDFDATGTMPCARHRAQPMGACDWGVARAGGGDATVVVTFPDGFSRALFFTHGEFISADASQAGGGFDARATKEGDLFVIRVDDERYEVPEAVIFGG